MQCCYHWVGGFTCNDATIGRRFHMKCCYHWVEVAHKMLLPLGGVSHVMLLPLGGGFT